MDRLEFGYMFDLAETMQALISDINDDYPIVSAYGKYDVIKSLLEDLIISGEEIANEIELQDYNVSNYDREFVLYLTVDGINVEKIYHDGEYYYGSADISFIHEDCNSKLLPYVDSKFIYEFGITDDEEYCEPECDYECCGCCDCNCENEIVIESDDNMHGFSVNHSGENSHYSYSFYSTDKKLVEEMAKRFR